MPDVRGDKRRTIVCPDDLWNGLAVYAMEHGVSMGAVIREQIRNLLEDTEVSGSDEVSAEQA
jgi:plasmid stability protein